MSNTNNAITAKAKAQFGERLKAKDYQELMRKQSIAEVITYLKTKSIYADCFEGLSNQEIRRGQFEIIVRNYAFQRYLKLIKFTGSKAGSTLHHSQIIKNDINHIMMYLRLMKDEDKFNRVANTNLSHTKDSQINFIELINAKNYQEFLKVLRNTPYSRILSRFPSNEYDELDFTKLELNLMKYYYQEVNLDIAKIKDKQTKSKINQIFKIIEETDNIKKIYRLKKYFQYDFEEIKKYLTPQYFKIGENVLDQMIKNLKADDFIKLLQDKYYSLKKQVELTTVENYIDRYLFEMYQHNMYFETDPEIILISYVKLINQEVQNIIEIIEGIRYQANMDKISKLLIY